MTMTAVFARALIRLTAAATLAGSLAGSVAALAGCYTTSGAGLFKHTGDGFTYISTEMLPVTVTVLNVCARDEAHPDGTPFFIMEIPPGKQLTFNFDEEGGDEPTIRPARMMYSLWKKDTQSGTLENILSCPGQACRKIVVSYRPAPEQAKPDEAYRMQVTNNAPGAVAQPRAPRSSSADR